MAWEGVITNAGASLLEQYAEGSLLQITSAKTGAGRVPSVSLMAQTNLSNEKQTASILSKKKVADGYKIRLQITAPETSYNLSQYGIWASLDSGSPVLLALFQHSSSIQIPSSKDYPDFSYTFYALLRISNIGELEINIDTSALVTQEQLDQEINAAVEGIGEITADEVSSMWYGPVEDMSAVALPHSALSDRDIEGQHPIEAVTGLEETTESEINEIWNEGGGE